jgi:menaquinone-dependent protoporphyrinogen oxidase
MRVLVVYGSARGGTEGLAEMVRAELRSAGIDSGILPANKVRTLAGYDPVRPALCGRASEAAHVLFL